MSTSRIPGIPEDIELSEPRRNPDKRFTYRQYKCWPDDERWEIIRGKAFDITEPPGTEHQRILLGLFCRLADQIPDRQRRLMMGPLDVLLNPDGRAADQVDSIVQPDLFYTQHPERFTDLYFMGIPDFIVEVICPWRPAYDLCDKLGLYSDLAVPECWVIHPEEGWLLRQIMIEKSKPRPAQFFSAKDTLTPQCLPETAIKLAEILPAPKPRLFRLKTEMIDGLTLRED